LIELSTRRRIVELLDQSQSRKLVVRFVVTPEIVTVRGVFLIQTNLPRYGGHPTVLDRDIVAPEQTFVGRFIKRNGAQVGTE